MPQTFVDLKAESITASNAAPKVREVVVVSVVMQNEGESPIPKGEAFCQITLDSHFIGKPSAFKGKQWKLQVTKAEPKGQYNMFIKNTGSALPTGTTEFNFKIKTKKAVASTAVTLASSLTGTAQVSDVDGSDQSIALLLQIS